MGDRNYGNGYKGYVDPNFPNPGGDGDASIIIYGYTPSFALAVLGVVLFTITLVVHVMQTLRHRIRYFGILTCTGCAFEIVGYIMRCLSAKVDPYRLAYFVVQYFFIVVAPVFFSAAIYGVLSSLIRAVGTAYKPILGPQIILAIFITADVVSTVVQIVGAALIGVSESNSKDPTTANNILLAGLSIQSFSFLLFLLLLGHFVWKSRFWLATDISQREKCRPAWRRRYLPVVFVFSALLIYMRTLFRLSETAEGLFSDLQTREVWFGCLEFMPVVLAIILLCIAHPGEWV